MAAMTADRASTPTYAPMPTPGATIRECVFCHFMVTLRQVRGGWYLWTADRDPLDGRRHCDGGVPAYGDTAALLTIHIPVPNPTGAPFAARYDPDGVGHHPQTHSGRRAG
jgi:hypothetical protein